ncbi:MAG: hypothetical protein QOH50_1810 [Kribbellaceae bacterium]|jgi:hypothetical protein|nr:hypothetical protein [Kribbellaceae bacterium]
MTLGRGHRCLEADETLNRIRHGTLRSRKPRDHSPCPASTGKARENPKARVTQIDGCQLEFTNRDALIANLNASGTVTEPCPWVGTAAKNAWSTSEAFVQFIGFEGRYIDFVGAIAEAQHSMPLLPGLARAAGNWRGVTLGVADALAQRFIAGKATPPSPADVKNFASELGIRDISGLATLAAEVHDLILRVAQLHVGYSFDPAPRIVSVATLSALSVQRDVTYSESLGAAVTREGAIIVSV